MKMKPTRELAIEGVYRRSWVGTLSRAISLLFLLRLLVAEAAAQSSASSPAIQFNDSIPVDERAFSEETLRSFQEDGDFDYGIRRKPTLSWWDRVMYWIARQWAQLFQYTYFGVIYKILFYTFCLAVIVFAILKLTGTNVRQLFSRRHERGRVRADSLEEDIYAVDFDQEIAQALREGDYRRGVRLRYIYALRKLTDRQLIRWRPGKTNHDYQVELRGTPFQADFAQLSRYYEYAWYGNFPTDQALYRQVETLFHQVTSSQTPA